jgi:hypothetical protein
MEKQDDQSFPIVAKLPSPFLEAIGHIMTTWARLEYDLRDLTFFILNVDPKRGRTAIRTPRPREILEMAEELLLLDGIEQIAIVDMSKLKSLIDELEFRRNVFAHNIWLSAPDGSFVVQNLQGSWPKDNGRKLRKRMHPEGKATTVADLNHVVELTQEAIRAIQIVRQEIAPKLLASRQRPPEQCQA